MTRAHMAWHRTLKSAATYTLAEVRKHVAVHLVDAKMHLRLITWSSMELAGILQEVFPEAHPCIA